MYPTQMPVHPDRATHHGGHSEVSRMHLFSQPVHLASCVDKDDSLCDGEGLVEITQCVQLPLLREQRARGGGRGGRGREGGREGGIENEGGRGRERGEGRERETKGRKAERKEEEQTSFSTCT